MKLSFKNDKIILYLNNYYTSNLNINNKEEINKYTQKILNKIGKKYYLHLNGYYNINMYFDNNFGIIMEIISQETPYLDYFNNDIDINIKVYKDSFLYEVNDINNEDYITYIYNNHIYVKSKKYFSQNFMMKFIEKVIDIKYGAEKDLILKGSKVLRWDYEKRNSCHCWQTQCW